MDGETKDKLPQVSDLHSVSGAQIAEYKAYLNEHHRSKSKKGNSKAEHRHSFSIEGVTYSFFAPGWVQWAHVSDRISFNWKYDKTGKWRNIVRDTIKVIDKDGKPVTRGSRDFTKPKRTAPYKMEKAIRHSPQSFDFDRMMGNFDPKPKAKP